MKLNVAKKKFRGGSGQIYFRGDLNLGGDLKFRGGADTPHDTMGCVVMIIVTVGGGGCDVDSDRWWWF